MLTLPSLFLSHGAPTLPLTDTPARAFLSGLALQLSFFEMSALGCGLMCPAPE